MLFVFATGFARSTAGGEASMRDRAVDSSARARLAAERAGRQGYTHLGLATRAEVAAARLAADNPNVTRAWPSGAPCKPSFMVIGAPKCGSTSLFSYLEAHPQVQQPARKELCFFSAFKRHLLRYRPNPSTRWPLYTASFAGSAALRRAMGRSGLDGGKGWGRGKGRGKARGGRAWRGKGKGRGMRRLRGRRANPGPSEEPRPPVPDARRRRLQATEAKPFSVMSAVERSVQGCQHKLAFEGCPFYLGEVNAATWLYRSLPQLRCIAVLRNPRERTVR